MSDLLVVALGGTRHYVIRHSQQAMRSNIQRTESHLLSGFDERSPATLEK